LTDNGFFIFGNIFDKGITGILVIIVCPSMENFVFWIGNLRGNRSISNAARPAKQLFKSKFYDFYYARELSLCQAVIKCMIFHMP
jgi:hypothetical protein